jgi:hypothetical protein
MDAPSDEGGSMNTGSERIEEEVEKTLRLLDEREEVEISPYFSSRLEARIRNVREKRASSARRIFGVHWLRPALVVFLIIINALSDITVFRGGAKRSTDRDEYIVALAREYSVSQDEYNIVFGRQ